MILTTVGEKRCPNRFPASRLVAVATLSGLLQVILPEKKKKKISYQSPLFDQKGHRNIENERVRKSCGCDPREEGSWSGYLSESIRSPTRSGENLPNFPGVPGQKSIRRRKKTRPILWLSGSKINSIAQIQNPSWLSESKINSKAQKNKTHPGFPGQKLIRKHKKKLNLVCDVRRKKMCRIKNGLYTCCLIAHMRDDCFVRSLPPPG